MHFVDKESTFFFLQNSSLTGLFCVISLSGWWNIHTVGLMPIKNGQPKKGLAPTFITHSGPSKKYNGILEYLCFNKLNHNLEFSTARMRYILCFNISLVVNSNCQVVRWFLLSKWIDYKSTLNINSSHILHICLPRYLILLHFTSAYNYPIYNIREYH